MRPDLSDPAQRAAYKSELRALAWSWRLAGFLLVGLGAAGLVWTQLEAGKAQDLRLASWIAVAAGWAVFIAVIVRRTLYHRTRMAEE
jgi:hypothetical protein